jgi:hypothetical protein
MMTADQSRALALYVNKYPKQRPAVAENGWNALTPEQQAETTAMFEERYHRPMDPQVAAL